MKIDNKTLQALASSLKFREMRQEIIASNVANANTPGYKAKRVDFEAALARALDTDEDEERGCPRKPIPDWARTDALVTALTKQASVDPDSIFQNTTKTCSLGSVFTSHTVEKMENRRSSSGDWFSDRLTWREELRYKQDMGFAANNK